MADIDSWQAFQNWMVFSALVGGIVVYYHVSQKQRPTTNTRTTPQPPPTATASKQQQPAKKPKKAKSFEKKGVEPAASSTEQPRAQDAVANTTQSKGKDASADDDFVKGMIKARQGINVKSSDKGKNDRVRTVKPKGSTPVLPSGIGQFDEDDAQWSPVVSPLPKVSGVDDMLEAPAKGPTSLRITAPQNPAKEKAPRQPKKEVVETKKQRQNRQKIEQQKMLRQEEESARKALEEKQRRSAREARGEPAKNGVRNAPAPATSAWSPLVTAQAPTSAAPANNVPLLDTFDVESTGSSNDAQASTAATSATDGVPTQWADDHMDEHLAEALKDSEAWEEVPSKQKSRTTKHEFNRSLTPAGAPIMVNGSNAGSKKSAFSNKANGFYALSSEDDG